MTNSPSPNTTSSNASGESSAKLNFQLPKPLIEIQAELKEKEAVERLEWAYKTFHTEFVLTTSFGIQSAVLLHMLHSIDKQSKVPVIWIDTGYLPAETYRYAEELSKQFELNLKVIQSPISPARMEAIYGRLWETTSKEDLEKYHLLRKVQPLEKALSDLKVKCWASGVRGGQTNHRRSMTFVDPIRSRLSLRPLLDWTRKEIFYYMQENNLPQHPLFEKGYSTVGDWHSSSPENGDTKGRETRFGGLKQECGIHLPGVMGEGI